MRGVGYLQLVSIVVAIYNAESTISKCIESIIQQTYQNLQIILVDDGSTDESLKWCEFYKKQDSRVIVLHKENGGLTSARLAGYRKSEGDYIVFIDSDDYLAPQYVEKQYNNIVENNSQVSICSYVLVKHDSEENIYYEHKKDVYGSEEFVSELILPRVYRMTKDTTYIPDFLWLRMFDINVVSESCFVSEREVYTEDVFFNFEIYRRCKTISILDECLYYYCFNGQSLTHIYRNNKATMEFNRVNLLRKYLLEYNALDSYRLSMATFKSVWGCIENASYLKTFFEFKKELIPTFGNQKIRKIVKSISTKQMTKGEKITFIGYKFKLYLMLYIFKRISRR